METIASVDHDARDRARTRRAANRTSIGPPRRSAPYDQEPGYYPPAGIWLYGNVRLLEGGLFHVERASGPPTQSASELKAIEEETQRQVLGGKVLVCGIHNAGHQRSAVVPLRWGSPRIVVMSGGFRFHLGNGLEQEPFRAARIWRYQWDPKTDLAISRRAPDRLPTYALHNPTVDRLIRCLAIERHLRDCTPRDPFGLD